MFLVGRGHVELRAKVLDLLLVGLHLKLLLVDVLPRGLQLFAKFGQLFLAMLDARLVARICRGPRSRRSLRSVSCLWMRCSVRSTSRLTVGTDMVYRFDQMG